VTIQMKAIEQYFHVVLFIILCKVVLTSLVRNPSVGSLKCKLFSVLSCGTVYMLYKVVLTFKSGDETLVCDHSNVSY